MRHVDSDQNTHGDQESSALHGCKQSAQTPKSAMLGSPDYGEPWTGAPSGQPVNDNGRKQSQARKRHQVRKPKPSFLDTSSVPPSNDNKEKDDAEVVLKDTESNSRLQQRKTFSSSSRIGIGADEDDDPFSQTPTNNIPSKNKASVFHSISPEENGKFSDPKGSSPTPRPRAAMSQNGGTQRSPLAGKKNTNQKKGLPWLLSSESSMTGESLELPRDRKLADAMRGASASIHTQESLATTSFKNPQQEDRASKLRPKLPSLDLEGPDSADADDVFDLANLPLSQKSPRPAKSRNKGIAKRPAARPKKLAVKSNKRVTKNNARAKSSVPISQRNVKDSGNRASRTDDSAVEPKKNDARLDQPARQSKQRSMIAFDEPDQDPAMVPSGSDFDDAAVPDTDPDDSDYNEQGKQKQLRDSSRATRTSQRIAIAKTQCSGTAQKQSKEHMEKKTQSRPMGPIDPSALQQKSSAKRKETTSDESNEVKFSRSTGWKGESLQAAIASVSEKSIENFQNEGSVDKMKTETRMPEPKKPIIIPFDTLGPKANGVSRRKSTPTAPQRLSSASTGATPEEINGPSNSPTSVALQEHQSSKQKRNQKIEDTGAEPSMIDAKNCAPHNAGDFAVQETSLASKKKKASLEEALPLDSKAVDNGMASESPSHEAYPPTREQDNTKDEEAVYLENDDHVDESAISSHHVLDGSVTDSCESQNLLEANGDHRNSKHIDSMTSPEESKQGENLDGILQPSCPTGYFCSPKPSVRNTRALQPGISHETALSGTLLASKKHKRDVIDVDLFLDSLIPRSGQKTGMEQPMKRQRLDQVKPHVLQSSLSQNFRQGAVGWTEQDDSTNPSNTEPLVEFSLADSRRHNALIPKKQVSAGTSRPKSRREPEIVLERQTGIEARQPGSTIAPGSHASRLGRQEIQKNRTYQQIAPKKDIAKQFLADIASCSNTIDQQNMLGLVQEQRFFDPIQDEADGDNYVDHRRGSFSQILSEREREFEKMHDNPDQALVEAMHRIVGVSHVHQSQQFTRLKLTYIQGVLQRLKEKEVVVDNIVDEYQTAGQDLVQRTARLHAHERRKLQGIWGQQQRHYMRSCDAARHKVAFFAKRIQAFDLDALAVKSQTSSRVMGLSKTQQTVSRL